MKRTYERILFMAIGAIISFCAYVIGCVSQTGNIQAQDTGEKVIRCEKLVVKEEIFIGGHPGGILIKNYKDKDVTGFQIRHGIGEQSSSSITMGVSTDGSVILLKDNKGTRELNTTNTSEYDQLFVNDMLIVGAKTGNHCVIAGGEETGIMINKGSAKNPDANILIGATNTESVIELQDSKGTKRIDTKKTAIDNLLVKEYLIVGNNIGDHVVIKGGLEPSIIINSGSFENPDSNISIGTTKSMATIGLDLGGVKNQGIVLMTRQDRNDTAIVLKNKLGMKTITTTD